MYRFVFLYLRCDLYLQISSLNFRHPLVSTAVKCLHAPIFIQLLVISVVLNSWVRNESTTEFFTYN